VRGFPRNPATIVLDGAAMTSIICMQCSNSRANPKPGFFAPICPIEDEIIDYFFINAQNSTNHRPK
jgi:hypothetical protein